MQKPLALHVACMLAPPRESHVTCEVAVTERIYLCVDAASQRGGVA